MAGEEFQEVKVLVPADRVAQFYGMVSRWLANPVDGQADIDGTYKPWADTDHDLAKKVWSELSPMGRELFNFLMEHPDQRVSTTEITERLGIANAQVRGVVGWPARHCYTFGRVPAIESEDGQDGEFANYRMASHIVALFKEARGGE